MFSMSQRQDDLSKEASKFIDDWLAAPGASDYTKWDVSRLLGPLEQRLRDAWERGRDEERVALVKLKEALLAHQESLLQESEVEMEKQPLTETQAGKKCFQTLPQAVGFIAELIERNSASELMAQFTRKPDHSDSFTEGIFPQLQSLHQAIDLRARYKGKHFPTNETRFELGGHLKELGCIHIDFQKTERGWVLDEIWQCR